MADGIILSRQDHDTLKRMLARERNAPTNQRHRSTQRGIGRHQTMYMPPGELFAWFSMYEDLAELGEADAYPTLYDAGTDQWTEDATQPLDVIYSTVSGITASVGDIVLCRWIRAESKWEAMPKPAEQRYVEYPLNQGVQGWAGTLGNPTLLTGNTSGWPGSNYVLGDEATVGIEYQPLETTPGTNGNYLINRTGAYLIELFGQAKWSATTPTYPTTTYTTTSTSGHTHDVVIPVYTTVVDGPNLSIELYRKTTAAAIGIYLDPASQPRRWIENFPKTNAAWYFSPAAAWLVSLDATDKIAFKFSLGGTFTTQTFNLVDNASPKVRVSYVGPTQDAITMF